MALSPQQLNGITQIGNLARMFLATDGQIAQLDTLFNDPNINWAADVTDVTLAEIPSFATIGLTANDVLTALFILKAIRTQMLTVNLPAFTLAANIG